MMFDGYGFGLVGLLYLVVWLALLVGLGVLIVLGIRWLLRHEGTGATRGGPADDPALTVLRERFARGEIDADEFEERRRRLLG